MKQPKIPDGWDEERVRRVLEHYDTQSDEEAGAEDEAALQASLDQKQGLQLLAGSGAGKEGLVVACQP